MTQFLIRSLSHTASASSRSSRRQTHRAFTLIEMVVVLMILAALAALVVPMVGHTIEESSPRATTASLQAVREAVTAYTADCNERPLFISDLLVQPEGTLLFDASTGLGWKGPYLLTAGAILDSETQAKLVSREVPFLSLGELSNYFTANAPLINDSWGNPIVLQIPGTGEIDYCRIVSAGANGQLETPRTLATPPLSHFPPRSACGDDLVLYLYVTDQRPPN